MKIFAAGALLFAAALAQNAAAQDSAPTTEKLKIVSACCIDNRWIFRVFDGIAGRIVTVEQGRPNSSGFSVENFNTDTDTAGIATPYGYFVISLNTPSANTKQAPQNQNAQRRGAPPPPPEGFGPPPPPQNISRRQVLEQIKEL
ncbi:MAG: hypothetical protein J6P03_05875 [Opitutales bacterium]|nr:hypothetical protein [Opitutales bacterium]